VTVPGAFVPFAAVTDGRAHKPALSRASPVRMRLRFQLPPGRPLAVERAVFVAKVRAPSRAVSVAAVADGQPVPLREEISPSAPLRVEITDPRHLRPDAAGGLFVELRIGDRAAGGDGDGEAKWVIESLGLDVTGRAGN
jgi:hypothetical protein